MEFNEKEYIWAERFRPKKIDDCVLSPELKEIFHGIVKSGKCPTLMLCGGPGVGKTTVAEALANELGADFLYINASSETSVDVIRTKVLSFASTVSFSDTSKITLLDEFDGMSQKAMESLKGFIEEFSGNHSFIFTTNNKHKIIEPIHSRSQVIDFNVKASDKTKLAASFFKRVIQILDHEKIEYEKPVIAEIIQDFFPDFRHCLNYLQKCSAKGKIGADSLSHFSSESFNALITALKDKKFNDMRKWVAQNGDIDSVKIFREFYDKASEKMQASSIPALIMHLGEYQYKHAFVADPEINMAAFLTEVMLDSSINWK